VHDLASPVSPLARHGAIRVAATGRYLEHADGTPFLWLGDTWWFGFVDRISDEEFAALAQRRRDEGFTVIQIVAGIYPEANFPDPLGARRGATTPGCQTSRRSTLSGGNWLTRRIATLLDTGLVPCIVGAWSYHLEALGDERMALHWREIIARWASHPVVFCVAGEAGLPPYDVVFTPAAPARMQALLDRWAALARGIRALDPYRRPLTVHPCPAFHHWSSSDVFSDAAIVDLQLLQTGTPTVSRCATRSWRSSARRGAPRYDR